MGWVQSTLLDIAAGQMGDLDARDAGLGERLIFARRLIVLHKAACAIDDFIAAIRRIQRGSKPIPDAVSMVLRLPMPPTDLDVIFKALNAHLMVTATSQK